MKRQTKQPSSEGTHTSQTLNIPRQGKIHLPTLIQRAEADLNSLHPQEILHLQRTIGNRAVTQLLQRHSQLPKQIYATDAQPRIQTTPMGSPQIQRAYSDELEEKIRNKVEGSNDFIYDKDHDELREKFTSQQLEELVKATKVLIDDNDSLAYNIIGELGSAMSTINDTEEITPAALGASLRMASTFFNRLKVPGLSQVSTEQEEVKEDDDDLDMLISKLNLPEERANEIKAHVEAYHKSRYYHMTRPINMESITKSGLDPNYGGSNRGLSQAHPDKESAEEYKKRSKGFVHLGKDYFSIESMESTLKDKYPEEIPQYIRVFLGVDQKARLSVDQDVDKGSVLGSQARAAKTAQMVTPQHIYQGKFSDLSEEQQRSLCSLIREFYPDPQPFENQVLQNHLFALKHQLIFTDDPNQFRSEGKRPRRYSF